MQRLKVSENKRFLCLEDGSPFFWLGDTAWELFHRLSLEEAERYFQVRAKQGFTVTQIVALAEFDGLTEPNYYGRFPLLKNERGAYDPCLWDTAGPNSYWDHVDAVLDLAEKYNMYVAFVATWGDKYFKAHGVGPEIFTPENARRYGRMLGERYGGRDNLLWVLGGDRGLAAYAHFKVNEALALGLREGEKKRHLITCHPGGAQSSSRYFPTEDWLDFNMIQSGHNCRNLKNYEYVQHDYALEPIKPTLDAEPRYEDHPVDFNPENGYFDAPDIRQAAYWGVFSGGLGITYGHHSVWRMNRAFSAYYPLTWEAGLERPGACQMRHLKALILRYPFFERVPAQELLAENYGGASYIAAARGARYALFYAPNGVDVPVRLGMLPGGTVRAAWYSPVTGETQEIGVLDNAGIRVFSPEMRGRDQDVVLCLESC